MGTLFLHIAWSVPLVLFLGLFKEKWEGLRSKPVKRVVGSGYPLDFTSVTRLHLPVSRILACRFPPAILPLLPPPRLPLSLSQRVVYGMPFWIEICLLESCCSGGRSAFCSQRSKASFSFSSVQVCSFLFLPAEASLLTPIFLPSLPRRSGLGGLGLPFFCFTTKTEMVTRLITRLGRSTFTRLLLTLQKPAHKGPSCWIWLVGADTSEMVCVLAFWAKYPLRTINTVCIDNAISNMLQFKPHLVLCLNRAYEALPPIHLDTSCMLIRAEVHIMCHSKEENSKRVGVDLFQAGNFVYIVTSGLFQGVQGQDYMGWMLVHWGTLFSHISLKESLLSCYPLYGTFCYPPQWSQHSSG